MRANHPVTWSCILLALSLISLVTSIVRADNSGIELEDSDRLVVAVLVLPGVGHHNRMSGMALELYNRGHHVVYCTSELLKERMDRDLQVFEEKGGLGKKKGGVFEFFHTGNGRISAEMYAEGVSPLLGVPSAEWQTEMRSCTCIG